MTIQQYSTAYQNLDLKDVYHSIIPSMAKKTPDLYPQLPDDSTSEEDIPDLLQTTPEECEYGTGVGTKTYPLANHIPPLNFDASALKNY